MKKRVLSRGSEYLRIDIIYYTKVYKSLQHDNKSLHGELKEKIPFTTIFTTKTWFAAEQIMTAALRRVKRYNRNKLDMEQEGILLSIQDLSEALTAICLTTTDGQEWSLKKGFRGYELSNFRNGLQHLYSTRQIDLQHFCFTGGVRA